MATWNFWSVLLYYISTIHTMFSNAICCQQLIQSTVLLMSNRNRNYLIGDNNVIEYTQ